MSRKAALAATAVVLALAAGPADAGLFGKKKPAPEAAEGAAPEAAKPATAPKPVKASREARAQAERADPLTRAAFWGTEVQIDPADAEAGVRLAAALRALGRFDEAAAAADRVVLQEPKNVEALLEVARAHVGRGQGFYAVQPLKRAMALAPRDWRAPSLLGVAYDQTRRPAEAREQWQAALKLSPENPSVLTNLALSHAVAGERDQAEALLRRAAARPDATIQTRQNLALLLGLKGATAEAERLLRDDLPPEVADANLAWLKSATAKAAAGRTWEALKAD